MRRGLPGGANSSNAPSKEKTFGGPDKDNSEEDENLVGRSSASGKVRRVACDICRERKVRCDRVQPTCGRCARLGHHCRYASSRKFSNLDIPQALVALHQRLSMITALSLTGLLIKEIKTYLCLSSTNRSPTRSRTQCEPRRRSFRGDEPRPLGMARYTAAGQKLYAAPLP